MTSPTRYDGLLQLLAHVQDDVPSATLGGSRDEPVVWLPAPRGYAAWVAFDKGVYVAYISRRIDRKRVWHKYVGHDRDPLDRVWPKARDWLNAHPELATAWQRERRTTATQTAATQPRDPSTASRDDDQDPLPPGFDPRSNRFYAIDTGAAETVQVRVDSFAASLVRVVTSMHGISEGEIYEAGALMYLAHLGGQISVLGAEEASYVNAMAQQLDEERLVAAPADALLASIVQAAGASGMTKDVVELLNSRLRGN